MEYKSNDVMYCGCNTDKILSAKPILNEENFRHLHRWIIDRYRIHILKDVEKKPAPWTENEILQNFRFTNVRREHDKETKWVINNICNIDMSFANKLINLVLFRMINKSETCKNFMPIDFENVDWESIHKYVESQPKDYVFFTNAFKTSGVKSASCKAFGYTSLYKDKSAGVHPLFTVIKYCEKLYNEEELVISFGNCTTMKEAFESLKNCDGLGDFLAYQILVDFTYCPESSWSENEFVVAGPGARRGLDFIFDNKDGMTYEECLFWLRNNWTNICSIYGLYWEPNDVFTDLPDYDRYMNVMSLQNCMCEISKYIRAVNGTGRPRNKYDGKGGV